MKKLIFVLILLLLAFYLPSQAELSDTIWTHLVPNVTSVKFSPDGKYIYAGSKSNIVSKIDVASNQVVKIYDTPKNLKAMDLSQDGKYLALGCDTTMTLLDTESGEIYKTFIFPWYSGINRYQFIILKSLSISYDNKYVAIVCSGADSDPNPKSNGQSNLIIWELETGKEILNRIEKTFYFEFINFSPTENIFAIGYLKSNQNNKVPIDLYEVGTWKLLNQFEGHNFRMDGFKFSKDGNLLASWGTSDTNMIKIWDMNKKILKQNVISDKYLTYGVWDIGFLNKNEIIISAENYINSKSKWQFTLINLDKQTKSIVADLNTGIGYLDLKTINSKSLMAVADNGVTLYNLEKTLDINLNENNTNITLYPNPVTKELNISLENITNTLVNYNIINNTGQIVQNNTSVIQNNILKINVSNVSIGTYLLNLNINNTQHSIKFVKE